MYLNKKFTKSEFIDEVSAKYQEDIESTTDEYQLLKSPFKIIKFNGFLNNPKFVSKLKEDVRRVEWNRKSNDLYSLWQTDDLSNYRNMTNINQFINILKDEVGPALEKMLNVKFNGILSVTASLYKHKDVLLCHDDKCDDRCVAFVYYLAGNGNVENGGAFEMFDHNADNGQPKDIVKSIPPVKNSFLVFEVGDFTYHQVSEVKSEDFERLSINGWFHSDRKLNLVKYKEPFPPIMSQINEGNFSFLDEYVNVTYLTPSVISEAQKDFEINSFILMKNYFVPDFYKNCLDELKKITDWTKTGPPNRKNYEILNPTSTTGLIEVLLKLIRSPTFIAYLKNMTGLDIIPMSEIDQKYTKLILEVQKWGSGCYTMATDNDNFFDKSGLDMYLFFNTKALEGMESNEGYINYLATDDDTDEDNELLNIDPIDNALIMVYRTSDTIKFTKYISHLVKDNYYCISATFYEPDVV